MPFVFVAPPIAIGSFRVKAWCLGTALWGLAMVGCGEGGEGAPAPGSIDDRASGGSQGAPDVGGDGGEPSPASGGSATGGRGSSDPGAGGAPDGESSAAVVLDDQNNYRAEVRLSIPTVETASARDLDICWADLDSDPRCDSLTPEADIDNIALLRMQDLSEEEVEEKLATGHLEMADVSGYFDYPTDHESTCAELSSLGFFGTPIDLEEYYTESEQTRYVLLFTQGTTPGLGAQSMLFLKPFAASANTTVNAVPGCGQLETSAELSSAMPVAVPAQGPWTVDWSQLETDAFGNPLEPLFVDGLFIAFYEDASVQEIEQDVTQLQADASQLWEMEVPNQTAVDLSDARVGDEGAPFAGFDNGARGVWLLGLVCNSCLGPLPPALFVLEPTSAEP